MALTEEQYKLKILKDVEDNGILAADDNAELDLLWEMHSDLSLVPRYYVVRLAAMDRLIANELYLVQTSADGRTLYNQQAWEHRRSLRFMFAQEAAIYTGGLADPTAQVDQMTAEFPVEGNEGYVDPNWAGWTGNIVARQLGGIRAAPGTGLGEI